MEAIIRHSPITHNGPIYSTYGNGWFPVAVYRTCCAKGSKAQSTVTHADPTHSGTRGFCLPVLAARHAMQSQNLKVTTYTSFLRQCKSKIKPWGGY